MKDRLYWERQDKEELERIIYVLKAVKRYFIYMILTGFICFIAAYFITDCFVGKVYTSEASFFIKKYPTNVVYGNSEYIESINQRSKENVLKLCYTFLQEDDFYYAILEKLQTDESTDELKKYFKFYKKDGQTVLDIESFKSCINYGMDTDAALIKCTVSAKTQELADKILNSIEGVVPQKYFEIYGTGMLTRIGDVISSGKPVSPNPLMNGLKCGLVAFSCFLLFVVVRYAYDDRIRYGIEFENKVGNRFLGMISDNETKVFSELSCKLDFILSQKNNNTVVFTSPDYEVDMTKLLKGLTHYIRSCEKTSLIVDLDFHYPVQHKGFGLNNSLGVTDILYGRCTSDEAIQKVSDSDVLTVGTKYKEVSDELLFDRYSKFVGELKSKYDYVLLVVPPVNIYPDLKLISTVDMSIVLLIKECKTTYKQLYDAMSKMESMNCGSLGVVLEK